MKIGISEQLGLETQRQTEDIPEFRLSSIAIQAHEVNVIGAQFIEKRKTFDELTLILRNFLGKTLTDKYVRANTGGKRIIATLILCWLLRPEILSDDCIEIQSTLQRFKGPAFLEIDRPRDLILLERNRHFCGMGTVLGNIAKQQLSLPLSTLAIIPSYSNREKPHIATSL